MFLLSLLQLGHSQDIFEQLRSNRHENKEVSSLLKNNALGHSEAEKAFRPWWGTLEDFFIYSLVILGVITVPTAIITGTPLDCSPNTTTDSRTATCAWQGRRILGLTSAWET